MAGVSGSFCPACSTANRRNRDKSNPLTIEPEELRLVLENPLGKEWDKLLLDSFTGLSPLVTRELAFRAGGRPGAAGGGAGETQK